MGNYIDLVLCKRDGKRELYQAPAWTLQKGDVVSVPLNNGTATAEVIAVMTVEDEVEKDRFAFALAATDATFPLRKVLGKVWISEFRYDEQG